MIRLKRVHDLPDSADGACFLVDRLWPRGMKKSSLEIRAWLKDVAPSTDLRKWFHLNPARWDEFRRCYFAELEENPAPWLLLLDTARCENVALLYSSHDAEHNNAVALKEFLLHRLRTENG
jgi:uncharacterized protein YeaO (DUF488 family)